MRRRVAGAYNKAAEINHKYQVRSTSLFSAPEWRPIPSGRRARFLSAAAAGTAAERKRGW